MPIGVWFHKMLSQVLTAMLGLMTLWAMGAAVQQDQQRLITSRINTDAPGQTSAHKVAHRAIDVYRDTANADVRYSFNSCHEESTLSEADGITPEGDDDAPSPPWTPFLASAVMEFAARGPALEQVLSAEVDLFKRRWRLLSAPARSPPTSSRPGYLLAAIG